MTTSRWVDERGAAAHAGVSIWTIRRWRADGRITAYKPGRFVRYDTTEIDAMIAATAEAPTNTGA